MTPARGALAALALLGGIAWAWVDSRPTWDDTGISALVVALIAGAASAFGVPAWLAGLVAAGPLIAVGLVAGNLNALIALIPAALGALVGALVRRAIRAGTRSAT